MSWTSLKSLRLLPPGYAGLGGTHGFEAMRDDLAEGMFRLWFKRYTPLHDKGQAQYETSPVHTAR